MMELDEIGIGTRLEFELIDNLGDKIGNTYISQLLEAVKNESIVISAPIFESRLVYIPVNAKVRITLFHKKYGLLGFTAVVETREKRGNIAVLCMAADTGLKKIQRRKYYRLDSFASTEYRICNGDTKISSIKPQYKKAITRNVSGSGACIVTEENIPKNSVIEIFISLSDTLVVKALCAVLRNTPIEIKKSTKYELGLHFTEISQRDQDNLIKHIFEQQRVLLKRDVLEK